MLIQNVGAKKQAKPNVTNAANERIAKTISIAATLFLLLGWARGLRKLISFGFSTKGSCQNPVASDNCLCSSK
jgi:hypothetical protein